MPLKRGLSRPVDTINARSVVYLRASKSDIKALLTCYKRGLLITECRLEVQSWPVRGVVGCFPHRSAHHASAAAAAPPARHGSTPSRCGSRADRDQRQREEGREGGRGVGFLDTKRVYLICDQPVYIKDPVSLSHAHTRTHLHCSTGWSVVPFPFSWFLSRCFTNPLSVRALFHAFAMPLCAGPCGPTAPSDLTR